MPAPVKTERALPPWVRVSTLQAWVGLSRQTIAKMSAEEPGAPRRKGKDGEWEYAWPGWNVWLHQRTLAKTEARVRAAKSGGGSALDDERIKKWRADRELAELDLRRKQGAVLDVAAHLALVGEIVAHLRAGLLAFPARVAPRLVGLTDIGRIEDQLRGHVADLMADLARPSRRKAGAA